jgi:hypothetical protein
VGFYLGGRNSQGVASGGSTAGELLGPGGTWLNTNSLGQENVISVTPLDPWNRTFNMTGEKASSHEDPTLGGLFPSAVSQTTWRGSSYRTGPRTFRYTIYHFGRNELGVKVYTGVNAGNTGISRDGKTAVATSTYEVFDVDGNSVLCFPLTDVGQRLEILEPCMDLLPLPEIPE